MSVLTFAVLPSGKPRPPADETKRVLGALIDDLQILAVYSPHLIDRIARMTHKFVTHHRAYLRARLDHHLDQSANQT